MTSDQLTPAQKAHGGLGHVSMASPGGWLCSSGAFGWAGGLGTTWMADPAKDLTVIVLTQRQFETAGTPQARVKSPKRRTRPWLSSARQADRRAR